MSIVTGDFDNKVPLTKLLALLVENDSILIQLLGLPDDRHSFSRDSSTGLLSGVPVFTKLLATEALRTSDSRQLHSLIVRTVHSASACVGSHESTPRKTISEFVRVLADLLSIFALLCELTFPSLDAISG